MRSALRWIVARLGLARRRLDDEARQEVAEHLELLADRYARSGMAPADARHAAQRRLGNMTIVREEIHTMNGISWLERLSQDVRYGARQIARQPGFTSVVAFTL